MSKITTPVFESFKNINNEKAILLIDENVFQLHKDLFKKTKNIIIKSGEKSKTQKTVDSIVKKLIEFKVDKTNILIGVGGGVVTDITGFVASVYMRGVKFGFVPTTLLAMVDASIGGKNGINFGLHKNFIGTINQPHFINIDTAFLKTLPNNEWRNGFAEIIKHAAIKSVKMFQQLEQNNISYYQKNKNALENLVKENIEIKISIVQKDVNETGLRKVLNFGHTLGHAVETIYKLSHGEAIAIGMCYAAHLSEKYCDFKQKKNLEALLKQYDLPTFKKYDKNKIFNVLTLDKKSESTQLKFVLLKKIGSTLIYSFNKNTILNEL